MWLLTKYADEWDNITDDQRSERVLGYDKIHCEPPLNDTDPQEVLDIWNSTKKLADSLETSRRKLEKMKKGGPRKSTKKNLKV